jgi:hypothetical protein
MMGALAVTAGLLLLSLAYASGTAQAGGVNCITGTPTPGEGVGSFSQQIPTCTPTRVRIKTHTPTVTNTPEATDTAAPTNTPVPVPTNTPKPAGSSEGTGVRPPNTGTGDAASGGTAVWALVLGAVLATAGSGTLAMGLRRRP